jgi:hypothetical protein
MKFDCSLLCRKTYWLLILPGLYLFTACGPIYQTEYSFIPPTNEQGRACVFQCENGKLQCAQIEDMRKERCDDRAEHEYYRCQDRGEKYCYRESCSADYENCESRYRGCFQSCGGKVESKQVCTAFCNAGR